MLCKKRMKQKSKQTLPDNSKMRDKKSLKKYDFIELGKEFVKRYNALISIRGRGFGLGFENASEKLEELERKEEGLEKVICEFRERDFYEKIGIYQSIGEATRNAEIEEEYGMMKHFKKMGEVFYLEILEG